MKKSDYVFLVKRNLKKLLLTMKLITILMFSFIVSINASVLKSYSQNTKLSLKMHDVTIKELMDEIEKSSEFIFIYFDDIIDVNRKISLDVTNQPIDKILDEVFTPTNNTYKVDDRQIVIFKLNEITNLPIVEILNNIEIQQPQRREISGTVTDSDGAPVIGATVLAKGTTIGINTDIDGKFQLTVPANVTTLVISFIGMRTQEINITNISTVSVIMESEAIGLEEVVVVGYGSQKKESIVGAIVQTTAEDLKRTAGVTNLSQALTGNLPGVTTILSSGEPGEDDPRILIRGMGTWNNSAPLILVDGVERQMNDLDISEVESVSVLKDASATAVFGVKGAEGVILITTKRGKIGKPQLSIDANVSTKAISKYVDKFDSYDAMIIRNNAIERELGCKEDGWKDITRQDELAYFLKPPDELVPFLHEQGIDVRYSDLYPNTDWIDESLADFPISSRVNLNVSGGTDFAKYFGSLAYTHDADLMRSGIDLGRGYQTQWGYDRFNYRTNLDFNITSSTTLSVNLSGYTGIKKENVATSQGEFNFFQGLSWQSPTVFTVRHLDGTWGDNINTTGGNEPNPIMNINTRGLDKIYRSKISSDFILNQKLDFLTQGLSIQGRLSYDNLLYSTKRIDDGGGLRKHISPTILEKTEEDDLIDYLSYNPSSGINEYPYVDQPADFNAEIPLDTYGRNDMENSERRLFYQVQMNYIREFGKHDVGGTFLMNREQFARGSMFPSYREDWVGRLTYNYDERYLFETNGAYNGSERFGPGYRFGFFPSLAVGWLASNESFLKKDWLSNLKFRYSIGKVGNDNYFASDADRWDPNKRWGYQTTWALDDGNYTPFGSPSRQYSPYVQYYEGKLGNPDLHWEVSQKQNFAVEIGVLRNRFSLVFDYYIDNRSDIFIPENQRNVAPYAGYSPVAANLGKTKGHGYEIEFKFHNTSRNMFNYWLELAYTRNHDEVIYKEDPELSPDYRKAAGYPIGQFRSQLHSGFLNNWDEVYGAVAWSSNMPYRLPGDLYLIDFDGNGVIDNFDSSVPYGYPERPQNTYTFTLGADYKGFAVMAQFYGVFNATRPLNWAMKPFTDRLNSVVFELQNDIWGPDNTDATWMSPHYKSTGFDNYGLLGVTDASYLRFRTAEISYTFSKKLVQKIGLAGAKLYLNGNNIFIWTKMVDDREANDYYRYPTFRRFTMGLNLDF